MSDRRPPLGFIGLGQMGAAICHAIHESTPNQPLIVVESNPDRQDWIRSNMPFVQLTNYQDLFSSCVLVFLAIKPQQIASLSDDISSLLMTDHVLISMLAGVSCASCDTYFSPASVVRIMPNTPATLGLGVTGIYFPASITDESRLAVQGVCQAFGLCIELKNEDDMNLITALSGSGPAFFYRMVHACIQFGVARGLDESLVRDAVIQTMLGASHMLKNDPYPEKQIERVTSPNGTTYAGLEVMNQQNFDTLISDVLSSAVDRAVELSKESAC